MKIGILTLPLHANYGGILQAYAMTTVLKRMGHEPKVIIAREYPTCFRLILRIVKRVFLKYLLHKKCHVLAEKKERDERPILTMYTQKFIDKNIVCLYVNSCKEVSKGEFDAYVVGSDQIWRCEYFRPIEDAYLNFARKWDVKRIAYAVSFGLDTWVYNHNKTVICSNLAKKFDWISVREESGINLCNQYLGVNACQVLDPTMLLKKEDYNKLISDYPDSTDKGDALVYVLDENIKKAEIIKSFCDLYRIKPFRVNSKYEDIYAPIEKRIQPPVEQWLAGFRDAQYVITDSYHACVFSIIYNKPFAVFKNAGRGLTRIESLLKLFGLEHNIISESNAVFDVFNNTIDWESVNRKWDILKASSMNLFMNSLVCKD